MYKTIVRYLLVLVPVLSFSTDTAYAWHGKTHKWLSQEAVKMLPDEEREFFNEYSQALSRGSVNADRWARLHHIYFSEEGWDVREDSAARFAETKYAEAIKRIHDSRLRGNITNSDKEFFAEACGQIGHMIEDMGNGMHTLEDEDQSIHWEIEAEVNRDIKKKDGSLESKSFQISFDGELRHDVNPYDGVIEVAKISYFGEGEALPARRLASSVPMGKYGTGSYVGLKKGWKKPLVESISKSLNIAANATAEVFEYMYKKAFLDPPETTDIETIPEFLQTSTPPKQSAALDTSDSDQN